jgi:CxxC motif-containing protein (DUF1111 family)
VRAIAILAWSVLGACGSGPELVGDDLTDLPLPGLDATWLDRFFEGDRLFEVTFTPADGLGPLFIRQSCAACHEAGGRGPGFVEKLVQVDGAGTPVQGQPGLPFGQTVRPQKSAGATQAIDSSPSLTVLRSRRVGPTVWAAGAIEALDEADLFGLERAQAQRTDGISGRVHLVTYESRGTADEAFHRSAKGDRVVGRFGVKARIAYLDDFAADAFQGDMGLTTPLRPAELPNPDGLDDDLKSGVDVDLPGLSHVTDYLRLLRLPARRAPPMEGSALFAKVSCDVCHVPVLRTRRDTPVPQLSNVEVRLFTDVLLHDLGPTFFDGVIEGEASPTEFKTPPLVGLRFFRSFLHDGRAATVHEGIVLHGAEGSEAKASVDAYLALSDAERRTLLAYLLTL